MYFCKELELNQTDMTLNVMKKNLLIIALLLSISSFSQKLTLGKITTVPLNYIFDELTKDNKYTVKNSKLFGDSLAKFDYAKGDKRILRYTGAFSTGCLTCLYYKYGYKSQNFAPDCIVWDNISAFVESYNNSMLSHLPIEAQNEINNYREPNEGIYTTYLSTLFFPEIERITDTTLSLYLHSDTLENLFKDNIDSLKFSVNYQFQFEDSATYSYQQLKTNGVTIKDNDEEILKIYVTVYFKDIPANYAICWCPVLNTEYRLVIPKQLK
jgi:hypothetical protein